MKTPARTAAVVTMAAVLPLVACITGCSPSNTDLTVEEEATTAPTTARIAKPVPSDNRLTNITAPSCGASSASAFPQSISTSAPVSSWVNLPLESSFPMATEKRSPTSA